MKGAAVLVVSVVSASTTFTIQTRCQTPGYCQTFPSPSCIMGTEAECGCLPSQYGTLCVECSGLGYLTSTQTCSCYDSTFDPNNALAPCMPIVETTQAVIVQTQYSSVTCGCHQSKQLGFFTLSSSSPHIFGDPNPPTCNECLGPIWGPQVGVIAETLLIPLQTCNSYGGPDPVQGPNGWFSCSGHGNWNIEAYRCDCDTNWMLRDTGLLGAGGEAGLTCDVCRPFKGASPEAGCSVIWTPEPVGGEEMECSGHGVQTTEGVCACYSNSTLGYWQLASLTAHFTTLAYNGDTGTAYHDVDEVITVETCMECMDGYSKPLCL